MAEGSRPSLPCLFCYNTYRMIFETAGAFMKKTVLLTALIFALSSAASAAFAMDQAVVSPIQSIDGGIGHRQRETGSVVVRPPEDEAEEDREDHRQDDGKECCQPVPAGLEQFLAGYVPQASHA